MKSKGVRRPTEDEALGRVAKWEGKGYRVDMRALREKNPKMADRIERILKEENE